MALGTQFDFPIHRGDDRVITFTIVDQAGAAVDITAATFKWNISRKAADSVAPQGLALLNPDKTVGAGITITDAAAGDGEIALDSADTVGFVAPSDYYHELQMTLASVVTTPMFGVIALAKDLLAPGP